MALNLSPTQKKILTYGVPVVAALALFAYLRSRSSTSTAATTTATTTGTTSSADQPIGLDQLASFENTIQSQLGSLGQAVAALAAQPNGLAAAATSGTTTASPPPNPTPATTTPAAFNEYPVGTVVHTGSPGGPETIVAAVAAGPGYVDVTNQGGLYGSGVGVSGSLYNPQAPPAGFSYSAQVQGNTVYEYGPNGVGKFSFATSSP